MLLLPRGGYLSTDKRLTIRAASLPQYRYPRARFTVKLMRLIAPGLQSLIQAELKPTMTSPLIMPPDSLSLRFQRNC